MKPDNKENYVKTQSTIQTVTLIAILFSISGVFVVVGQRDQTVEYNSRQIEDLRSIATDLVKSQVLGSANDAHFSERFDELKTRVDRLER